MHVELSTWQPLWEFSAIVFVMGIAGCWQSRDRGSWWMSQGLIVLSIVLGLAAANAVHPAVDLFSLSTWAPVLWTLTLWPVRRFQFPVSEPPAQSGDVKA